MGVPTPSVERVADVRAEAQRMVDDVVAAHPGIAVGVSTEVEAMTGTPAEVLLEASLGADLLVVGHRGRGAFSSALLGSVGLQCVLRAACPVTIVRPVVAPADRGPGSAGSGGDDVVSDGRTGAGVRAAVVRRTAVRDVMTTRCALGATGRGVHRGGRLTGADPPAAGGTRWAVA